MKLNLALSDADAIVDLENPVAREGVGVVVHRGVAKLLEGRTVVASMMVTSIDEVEHQRVYRIVGPDATWLVRRSGGCGPCAQNAAAWPLPG